MADKENIEGKKAPVVVNTNGAGAENEDEATNTADAADAMQENEQEDGAEFTNVRGFDDILKAARALEEGDGKGVLRILREAAALGVELSKLDVEFLVQALHEATGAGKRALLDTWKWVLAEEEKLQQQARATASAAADAEAERRRQEERQRIWASCGELATSEALLDQMVVTAKKLGLVNEDKGVRAVYLTCTSRLLATSAVRLLRLGSTASGKNYPVEVVLRLIPEDAIIQVSGASAKVLPYYGGANNRNALKYKIVYIPEAVILSEKQSGIENEFTAMLRTLISEGRLVYHVVETLEDGSRETKTYIKDGPIGAIFTTARDLDREMKTRALVQETDESGKQTEAIVKHIFSRPEPEPRLTSWLDLQRYLELEAPYRVDIPFREAISRAYDDWRPGFLENASMRMRRDASGFLVAVEASAVLHKVKRDVNADGIITATLDDYQHAYTAFGEGLAVVHGKADDKLVATVAAIEAIAEEQKKRGNESSVIKVTLRDLAKRLRVGSLATASARLGAALDYGAIEQVEELNTGRTGARYFELMLTAKQIGEGNDPGVFPPPEYVSRIFMSQQDKAETRCTNVQGSETTWF
jgi:hypothetical protein